MIYFNFPIDILPLILVDDDYGRNAGLEAIFDYCKYEKQLHYSGTKEEKSKIAYDELGIVYDGLSYFKKGMQLYNDHNNSPKTGISHKVLFDFYENPKTEFEKICLITFLGLKSIIGKKQYSKTNWNHLLARMSGKPTFDGIDWYPDLILKYNTRRYKEKVIEELQDSWGLKYYAYYTRGFYFSFTMERKKLIEIAELKRKTTKKKIRKLEEESIRAKIFENVHKEYTNGTLTDKSLKKVV